MVSYAAGGTVELIFAMRRKENINEGFLVTGMLFPLILPPTLSLWMVAVGVAFGVFVGKELFGGTGRNIFNPAIVGCCFLALAYPAAGFTGPYKAANKQAEEILNILAALRVPLQPDILSGRLVEIFNTNVRKESLGKQTIYVYSPQQAKGEQEAVAVRFSGPGVWGPIKGFLALESDRKTIRGITFYEQEETPGLGGEIVCVGGGCGMAPIKNIIYTIYDRWSQRRCWLFFGCRTTKDIFYLREFEKLAGKYANFNVVYALSDEREEGGKWGGETGFIHLAVDKYLTAGVRRHAFLCGPPPMIEAVTRILEEKGLRSDDIFYDKF